MLTGRTVNCMVRFRVDIKNLKLIYYAIGSDSCNSVNADGLLSLVILRHEMNL